MHLLNCPYNLSALHSECEVNYSRLLNILPFHRQPINAYWQFKLANHTFRQAPPLATSIRVIQQSRYTSTLLLTGHKDILPWLDAITLTVKLYQDVRMAEVVPPKTGTIVPRDYYLRGRYELNNKLQLNFFLSEWLLFLHQHTSVL